MLSGMTTPPKVDDDVVAAAIMSVLKRHTDHDDDRLEQVGQDPHDVLVYLRKRFPHLPQGLRCDDMDDVFTLLLFDWWEQRRIQRYFLRQVVTLKLRREPLAAVFGMSVQGFKDWLNRLDSLLDELGTGRPDEKAARARGRTAIEDANLPASSEQAWLDAHMRDYEQVARDLVGLWMVVDEETADQIVEVRRDVQDGAYEADALVVLGLALEALERGKVRPHRPHLDEGEEYTVQEDEEYAEAVADAERRREALLDRFRALQVRRREVGGW